jgi:hypothetical protein
MSVGTSDKSFDLKRSTRRGTLSVVMWVFGLSTTLLLVALWGRAVTIDQGTIAESAGVVVDADIARGRINDWIEDAMVQTQVVGPVEARAVVGRLAGTPEMDAAIDNLTSEFVQALFAPEGTNPVVDVRSAMSPVVPVLVEELAARDIPVSEAGVLAVLDANDLALGTGESSSVFSVVREARSLVSTAVVVALFIMLVSGAAAIALSDEKYAMVRTLGIRVLLSAVSFSIFFRVGGWALDPERGRSPIAGGTSILLGSNGHVFVITGLIAAAVAGFGAWIAWSRKRGLRIPTQRDTGLSDGDTRELVTV